MPDLLSGTGAEYPETGAEDPSVSLKMIQELSWLLHTWIP